MSHMEYAVLLQQFINKLTNTARTATLETGRKFDKVFMVENGQRSIRYFISKKEVDGFPQGSIFGAKSVLAPNLNWYFGTLENSDSWKWDGHHGEPVNDDTVELVKQYGDYKHYRPKTV